MRRRIASPNWVAALLLVLLAAGISAADPPPDVDRSPADLVLAPDGSWLVTANQTSHTASLVGTSDGKSGA